MTPENRETLQRAIGMLEGISFAVEKNVGSAIACAIEMLEDLLKEAT